MGSILSSLVGGGAGVENGPDSERVLKFSSSAEWKRHFDECKKSSKLLVIDFTASWCGPCKFISPAINAMAENFTDVVFVKLDVDQVSDVAREWEVQAMPTFVLVKEGKEVDRVVGAKKDELERKIAQHRA